VPTDPHAVQISVDGSCFPNEGRKSGYAGVVVYPDDPNFHEVLFQGFEESTINRMELSAVIAAMAWVREKAIGHHYSRVQIFSDSQYVVDGQRSAPRWQKSKWRNAYDRPIENSDLWKLFLLTKARAGTRVDVCKVLNKSTALLKHVDKLAKAAAKSRPRVDRGLIVGKIGRAKVKGAATMFPAAGEIVVIRVVRSRTVGRTRENRFVVEVYDEETQAYISKHFCYCTPEIGAQLHRQRGFRVQMNANPKYPQIIEVKEELALPKVAKRRKLPNPAEEQALGQ
jgi:ribonuclease HI